MSIPNSLPPAALLISRLKREKWRKVTDKCGQIDSHFCPLIGRPYPTHPVDTGQNYKILFYVHIYICICIDVYIYMCIYICWRLSILSVSGGFCKSQFGRFFSSLRVFLVHPVNALPHAAIAAQLFCLLWKPISITSLST